MIASVLFDPSQMLRIEDQRHIIYKIIDGFKENKIERAYLRYLTIWAASSIPPIIDQMEKAFRKFVDSSEDINELIENFEQ